MRLSHLISHSSGVFAIRLASALIGYFSTLYITNTYDIKIFGMLALSLTFAMIFSMFSKFGMPNALVKMIGTIITNKKYSQIRPTLALVIASTSIFAALLGVALYLSANIIAEHVFRKIHVAYYLKIISVVVVTNTVITVIAAAFQGFNKIKKFVFVQTVIAQLAFVALLAVNHFAGITENLVLIFTCANVVAMILSILLLINLLRHYPSEKTETTAYLLTDIIKLAAPMLLAGSSYMLMAAADIFMLGIYHSEVEVGIYSVAQKLAGVLGFPLLIINAVAKPRFVEFHTLNDLAGLSLLARQSTKLVTILVLPLLLLYASFPGVILGFFGDIFVSGTTALLLLAMTGFIYVFCGSINLIMHMTGHQKIVSHVILLAATINILVNYLLIPRYGINGAALASLLSTLFSSIILLLLIKKKLGFWMISIPSPAGRRHMEKLE